MTQEEIKAFKGLFTFLSKAITLDNKDVSSVVSNFFKAEETLKHYIDVLVSSVDVEKTKETLSAFCRIIEILIDKPQTVEQQQLCDSYKAWGEMGWTLPPSAPIGIFHTPPVNLQEANKEIMSYCTEDEIKKVFSTLSNAPMVDITDLNEVRFCFENQKYKSCVLLLFSMLDRRIIRLLEVDEKQWRPVGAKATGAIVQNVQKQHQADNNVLLFQLLGMEVCFQRIFAEGKDFRCQPAFINRNFLSHGMYDSLVSKTECIRVLLLYYKAIELFEYINVQTVSTDVWKEFVNKHKHK